MKRFLKLTSAFLIAVALFGGIFYQSAPVKADSYPYLISINKQMNTITIYGKNEEGEYKVPVKAFICSTGWATPLGDFTIQIQYRWKELMNDCWGQYSSRVTWDGIIIHSVWYYGGPYADRQNSYKFNALGTTNSNGCINLAVQDCKWIYDNCPVGSPIHIYNSSNPGPLGKPEMLKVPYSIGYDPTDRWSPNNPYNGKKPVINGVKNHKVGYGEKYTVMDGVTALNTTGYDATKLVTADIRFNGRKVKKVDTKKPGIYNVKYKITDQIGRKAEKSAVITVVDNVKPEIKNVKDRTVPYGTRINRETAIKYVKARWHKEDLTKDIKIIVEMKKDGYYKVIYTVEAPNGKKSKAVCHYTIRKKLRFEGIEDRILESGGEVTTGAALNGVKAYWGDEEIPQDSITITIKPQEEEEDYYVYKVIYSVENDEAFLRKKAFFRIEKPQDIINPPAATGGAITTGGAIATEGSIVTEGSIIT